jgi:hypothetical protein
LQKPVTPIPSPYDQYYMDVAQGSHVLQPQNTTVPLNGAFANQTWTSVYENYLDQEQEYVLKL